VGFSGEVKSPSPVSGVGSSNLRGLFHPNASTVAHDCYAAVAGILNVDESRFGCAVEKRREMN
jgi:hypothetical protein